MKLQNKVPKVALILTNYNKKDITIKTIGLLKKQSLIPDIILIDDSSHDDSVKKISSTFPDTLILENEKNLGGSESNYKGVKFAYDSGYDAIIISDNDAFPISKHIVEDLVNKVLTQKEIGFAVPRNVSVDSNSEPKEEFIKGHMFHFFTFRKEIIDKVGYLDPEYFIQVDDSDYSKRIRDRGYFGMKMNYLTYSHPVKPLAAISPFFVYYTIRNSFYYNSKWNHGFKKLLRCFFLLAKTSIIISFDKFCGDSSLIYAGNLAISDFIHDKRGKSFEMDKNRTTQIILKQANPTKPQKDLVLPKDIYLTPLTKNKIILKDSGKKYLIEFHKKPKIIYPYNFLRCFFKYFRVFLK